MSKGCHRLIRDGARLVENVSEILQELAAMAGQLAGDLARELGQADAKSDAPSLDLEAREPKLRERRERGVTALSGAPWEDDPEYRALWDCLGYEPCPVDDLIDLSGLTARAVSAMLLMLELRGMVEAHPGGAYSRKK